jgi:hypothetical protein
LLSNNLSDVLSLAFSTNILVREMKELCLHHNHILCSKHLHPMGDCYATGRRSGDSEMSKKWHERERERGREVEREEWERKGERDLEHRENVVTKPLQDDLFYKLVQILDKKA